jgi:hypothetical protein
VIKTCPDQYCHGELNRPSIMVYGGTIHSENGKGIAEYSAFEALGKNSITNRPEDFKGDYQKCLSRCWCLVVCIPQTPCRQQLKP